MPRRQRYLRRLIASQTFADASRLVIPIDRNHDLSTLLVTVTASVVVSNDYTAAKADAPLQLVNYVRLIANGVKTLISCNGALAYVQNIVRNGNLPTLTAPGVTVATHTAECAFFLDLGVPDGRRPKDSHFPTRGLTSFDLELTMGSGDDLFTDAGDGASTFTGTVKVFAVQMQEYVGKDGKFTLPGFVQIRSQQELSFDTSNTNYLHRIPSKQLLRGLIFRAHNADVVSNSILNNVKVMLANETIFDLSASSIRTLNRSDYAGAMPTGNYFVDFAGNGNAISKLTDMLDLSGNVDLDVYLDVTGSSGNKIQILPIEFERFVPTQYGLLPR